MLISVDVGTSNVKAGLFTSDGTLVRQASEPVSLLDSTADGRYEIDPRAWERNLDRALSALVNSTAPDVSGAPEVEAVVVSGNGPTLVPVGAAGEALHPAITWMDRRGVSQAVARTAASEVDVDASYFLSKAYWICRERPEIYERTRYFLSCPEYIAYYLCGEAVTILPVASFERYIWTGDAIRALGMDGDRFPPFVAPGAIVGPLKKDIARRTGLREATPVIAGGPDYLMSLLGAGSIRPGVTCDRAGSSEGINLCSKMPVTDRRLLCLPHLVEGYYNISGVISTSGKALDWFRNVAGFGKGYARGDDVAGYAETGYEPFFAAIARSEPGSGRLLFLPYLAGERSPLWDPHARGVFAGLAYSHTRCEMARAVAESIGFAMRDVLTVMEENALYIDALRVAGKLSRAGVLNQIKADITGRRVLVPVIAESELLGAACIGLASLGYFASFEQASAQCVRIGSEFLPRPNLGPLYGEMFEQYRELYRKTRDINRALSAVEARRFDA